MTLIEPGVCRVDVVRGQLVGATSHYVKTLADLDGLYEDAVTFDALKGVMIYAEKTNGSKRAAAN